MLTCGRCGRRLAVAYTGNPQSRPVYRCDKPNLMMGLPRCMTFGGPRVDAAIARELLRAVEPAAIEAALEAERMHRERQDEEKRILDLELQQARYEADLAERRYAACDPDNRLIAAQLEKNWEAALRRVQEVQARCCLNQEQETVEVDPTAFANLADNLSAAWNAPGVTMRARQQLLRALIVNIVVDVDDQAREVVLVIHWRGGQHSELRVRKPRTGEHGCATTEDALAGRSLVRRAYRCLAEPDGHSHGPRQNLDGQTRELGAPRQKHPCLSVRRKGWRLVDHVGCRQGARRDKPHHPTADQSEYPSRHAGCAGRALPNPRV